LAAPKNRSENRSENGVDGSAVLEGRVAYPKTSDSDVESRRRSNYGDEGDHE
jgi:hypothetical protein